MTTPMLRDHMICGLRIWEGACFHVTERQRLLSAYADLIQMRLDYWCAVDLEASRERLLKFLRRRASEPA